MQRSPTAQATRPSGALHSAQFIIKYSLCPADFLITLPCLHLHCCTHDPPRGARPCSQLVGWQGCGWTLRWSL